VPRVLLLPANLPVDVDSGTSLFDAARRVGIAVDTACGGNGTCGLCRVRVVAAFDSLSPLGPVDKKLLGDVYAVARERLACQAKVNGDCTIDVPAPRPSKRDRKSART
jgi:ferredoxin